jgi:hypothetical protein
MPEPGYLNHSMYWCMNWKVLDLILD